MILHDYVRLLRRGWWVALLFGLLGAGGGAALAYSSPPVYYSQATVYVALPGNGSTGDLQAGNAFTVQRAQTYADLALTTEVLSRASAALSDNTPVDQLRGAVTSVARPDRALIDITASGTNPGRTMAEVDAVANALIDFVPSVEGSAGAPVRLAVVQYGALPRTAASPTPRNNILLGLLAGLLVGVAIVVVADALDNRIRTLADLPRRGAQPLATVTSIPARGRRPPGPAETDVRVESIRHLRANLQFGAQAGSVIAVAGVTQAADADGVARELGAALGEIGSVVVVVDLDLRIQDNGRHRHERPGSAPTAGVADVLNAARTVDEVLTRGGAHQVFYIPAGSVDPASAQRLSTPAMRTMLDALRARFDYVLLACPPVVDRSESAVAAALAGSSLLIVESGATKRSELLHALELLAGVRVNSVSVAIDHVRGLDLGHTNSHLTTTPAPHEATPPTSASSGVGAYGGEHPSGRGQGPHAIG